MVLAIVFGVAAIGLGILYNKLVIKDYPDKGRKAGYVLTVVVFVLCAGALYCTISIRPAINTAITESITNIDQSIKEAHAANGFVRNGLDLNRISGDVAQAQRSVAEIKSILPTYKQIGIPQLLYDIVVDSALQKIIKNIGVINASAKAAGSFADENNVVTVTSIMTSIQRTATTAVNIVFLIITAIFAVVLIIYIIKSLLTAKNARKSAES